MKKTQLLFLMLMIISTAPAQVKWGGFAEYDKITYFRDREDKGATGRNQIIGQFELSHERGGRYQVFSSLEFRNDQADPARNRVYMDEVYINMAFDNFDLRLGKQIYSWGRADGFNPTDNLSAWDYSDVLDTEDEKIGQISARLDYYLDDWTIEAVLVPSFTPSKMPLPGSRWFEGLAEYMPNPYFDLSGVPTLQLKYKTAPAVLPAGGIRSWQYALQAGSSWLGWDFSLSWFDGFDDLPVFGITIVADSSLRSATIVLTPRYNRRRALGADLATALGPLGLRAEAAYYLTEDWQGRDDLVDDPYLQYVIGVDYTLRRLIAGQDMFVLLQWVQEIQIPRRNTLYSLYDLNHVFRKSLLFKADLNLGAFSRFTFEGAYNIYGGDWWLRPGLDWGLADGIHLLVQADVMGGPQDSFFGLYDQNNRGQLRLKYSF